MNKSLGQVRWGRWLLAAGVVGLLAGCAFPKRDYSYMPDASIIQVQRQDGQWVAVPPDCSPLYPEYPRQRYDSRPQVAFGCATYTNLANSVAHPLDLAAPGTYAGQSADTAGSAVTQYQEGKVTPLRKTDSTKKAGN